jgi:hypothetical protein
MARELMEDGPPGCIDKVTPYNKDDLEKMFKAITEGELKSAPAMEAKSAASAITAAAEAAAEAAAATATAAALDGNTDTQEPHDTLVLSTIDQNPNPTPNRVGYDGEVVAGEVNQKHKFHPAIGEKCRDFLAGRCRRGPNCRFSHEKSSLPVVENVVVHTEDPTSEMEAKNKSDFEPVLISKKDAEFASNASIPHFTLPRLANDSEESPDEATLSLESGRTNGAESLAETVTETGNGTSSTIPDAVNSRPETPNEQTSSEANVLVTIDRFDHTTTPGNSPLAPTLPHHSWNSPTSLIPLAPAVPLLNLVWPFLTHSVFTRSKSKPSKEDIDSFVKNFAKVPYIPLVTPIKRSQSLIVNDDPHATKGPKNDCTPIQK